jgi:hypothetical protein
MSRRPLATAAASTLALLALTLPLEAGATHGPRGTAAASRLLPHAVMVGIGEDTPYVFEDPHFWRTGILHARLDVGWDSMDDRVQSRLVGAWMRAARAHGIVPLVTFDRSRRRGRSKILPSVRDFAHEFRIFRRRYPWVKEFASWNEANLCREPTCHHVDRVVGYWRAMVHLCPGCKVLAAEVLDVPGMTDWVRQFIHIAGFQPKYWGLHNYLGANRLDDNSTRAITHVVHGQIWLTETAGLVHRRHLKQAASFPENAAHAALVTRFLLSDDVFVSPRITRIYLYEWNAVSRFDSWDSGLIGYNHRARPAYGVLLRELAAPHTHLKVG